MKSVAFLLSVVLVSAMTQGIGRSQDTDSLKVTLESRFNELHKTDSLEISRSSMQLLARVSDRFRLLLELGSEMGEGPTKITGFNPFHNDTEETYEAFVKLIEEAGQDKVLTTELSGYLLLAKWRLEAMGGDVTRKEQQRVVFEEDMRGAKTIADFRAIVTRYGAYDFAVAAKKRLEDLLIARARKNPAAAELVIKKVQPGMPGARRKPQDGETFRATIESATGNPFIFLVAEYPGDGPYPFVGMLTPMDIMTDGSVHRYRGNYTFQIGESKIHLSGQESDPLTFLVVRGSGYVYLHGKGTVTMDDGTVVRLADAE